MKLIEFHKNKTKKIVLLTGYMLGTWAYRSVIDKLADWHVLVFENIGSDGALCKGRSHTLSIDAIVQILSERQIDHVHLAGHSLGGFVAQEFAIKYPQFVASLILMGSCHLEQYKDSHRTDALPTLNSLFDLDEKIFFKFVTDGIFSPEFLEDPGFRQVLWDDLQGSMPQREACRDQLHMLEGLYATGGKKAIKDMKSLALYGDKDIVVPPEWVSSLVQHISPSPEFSSISSSHMFMYEAPEACADILGNWLEKNQTRHYD